MNTFPILDIRALVYRYDISKSDPQIRSHNLVHPYLWLLTGLVSKGNADSISPFLPLDQDRISTKQLELLHGIRVHSNNRIVIIDSLINNQPIRGLFPLKNSRAEVSFSALVRGFSMINHGLSTR
uniref:Uncharacterized protein n=1 Tax=Opuntia streptacantha TaxID=393608 RepID=A0A7C9CB33_OPUST